LLWMECPLFPGNLGHAIELRVARRFPFRGGSLATAHLEGGASLTA
jgi:hypothetical protein